ncbi:MAG: class I SAM-dependent methyltransferase [Myxococcota bacterium]
MAHHHHPHRFPFEKAHLLDDAPRRARQPAERLVEAMALEPSSVVIDFGAGTGYLTLPVARKLEAMGGSGSVAAVDVEPRMLEVLAQRAGELTKRISCANALPVGTAIADRVLVVNLLHELDRPVEIFRHIRALLRPGGWALVSDWEPGGTAEIGPPPEVRLPVERAEEWLGAAGFGEVERLNLFEDFWTLRALTSAEFRSAPRGTGRPLH